MTLSRRSFLVGLFAAPAIVKAEWLMPPKSPPLPYMRGDLINFKAGMWQETGWYAVCEPLRRVEGQHLVFSKYQFNRPDEEVRIPAKFCELFHGLPGNRVRNPSTAHRLIRHRGFAWRYAEDPTQ